MPEPPRRTHKPAISPTALRRRPLTIPESPTRAFMDELIRRSSRIADIGFGRGKWVKHVKKVNPKAHVYGIEARYKSEPDRTGKKVRQEPIEIKESFLSYRGFEHWLEKPEQFELVNLGLFLLNHHEFLQEQNQKRNKEREYRKIVNEEVDRREKKAREPSARQKVTSQLKKLRAKKLKDSGVLRVVEWDAGRAYAIRLLREAGFSRIIYRKIPKEETISLYEQTAAAGDDYITATSHGPPYEIYAFK